MGRDQEGKRAEGREKKRKKKKRTGREREEDEWRVERGRCVIVFRARWMKILLMLKPRPKMGEWLGGLGGQCNADVGWISIHYTVV